MALWLREADVQALLSIEQAIDALDRAFREYGAGAASNSPRARVRAGGGVLHVMAAAEPGAGATGVKVYSSYRSRARFLFLLYSTADGTLQAVIEADLMGALRTGAASGLATKYLARAGADTLALIGTGWQARTQLAAVAAVRRLREIRAFSRDPARCRAFCEEMARLLDLNIVPAGSARAAVEGAAIVVTMTTAAEPVLEGAWLAEGVHVNAAGANSVLRREIDDRTLALSSLIAVDSRDQARIEAGDLVRAVERGQIPWEQVREIGEIVSGRSPGRPNDRAITIFRSLGIALEDVAVARLVYERAREAGRGETIAFWGES